MRRKEKRDGVMVQVAERVGVLKLDEWRTIY